MAITNNTTVLATLAVADTTFNTTSQYTLATGVSFPFTAENLNGITFSTDRLTVTKSGIYKLDFFSNINSFPGTTAKISLRWKVNNTTFSTRKFTVRSDVASDSDQIHGSDLISLSANDYLQIYIASDTSGNVLIGDASFILTMVKATS